MQANYLPQNNNSKKQTHQTNKNNNKNNPPSSQKSVSHNYYFEMEQHFPAERERDRERERQRERDREREKKNENTKKNWNSKHTITNERHTKIVTYKLKRNTKQQQQTKNPCWAILEAPPWQSSTCLLLLRGSFRHPTGINFIGDLTPYSTFQAAGYCLQLLGY